MLLKELGQSGLKISCIGFGAWGIGGKTEGATSYGETDDRVSLNALNEAFDQGINFYDTSNVYGAGHSEELIGKAFKSKRDQVVIATKGGYFNYKDDPDFSAQALKQSIKASLNRLQTDYIDLFQLHNPFGEILSNLDETCTRMEHMKKEGLIRAFGMSLKSPQEALEAIERYNLDSVQVNFNMLDTRVIQCGLIEKAFKKQVSIIARTPLSFGFLTGNITKDTVFSPDDHRSRWPQEQIDFWLDTANTLFELFPAPDGYSSAINALRFCLSIKGITSTIPGILRPEEVALNISASDLKPFTDAEILQIVKISSEADRLFMKMIKSQGSLSI